MDVNDEKQALVGFGLIFVVGGAFFAIWGSNMMSTANACTSSFSCSLGATINGNDPTAYYELGQLIMMVGLLIAILGVVAMGYGLSLKTKKIDPSLSTAPPWSGASNADLQASRKFCTKCGSGLTLEAMFCGACGTRMA